jgi:predicted ATPase/DNA-binding SARP family transcriptional activator
MLLGPWRVEMLGGLRAVNGARVVTRFRSERTAGLFAYLAYHLELPRTRAELIEMFWPEADLDRGRMSLRTALASLRRQFEPPGTPPGAVICADSRRVHLNPLAIVTDAREFEDALDASEVNPDHAFARLESAVSLYRGELLAGFYDPWMEVERARLAERYLGAVRMLIKHFAEKRSLERALQFAEMAVGAAPLREDVRRDLIRLLIALGRPSAARQQFLDLEERLREDLGVEPSDATRALVERLSVSDSTRVAFRTRDRTPPSSDQTVPESIPSERIPVPLNRFFGRQTELGRLVGLLNPESTELPARLATITGPGGTGKTRLAAEASHALKERFNRRVWFVPLGDLCEARLIPSAILEANQIRHAADPLARIAAELGNEPSLLVLDNFEQLAHEGPAFVSQLLTLIPALRILVTSRRRLDTPGEREIPLAPLPTPGDSVEPEHLLTFPSVQLYVDRAQAAAPDFQVTRGNAASVAALCERLEGIPLAIELAAARAQVLTPAQMLEKLDRRFEILATRRMDKGSRHRSLWAAIDWSYSLLSPPLQRLFARLSVFRGGWTAEAAANVCDEPSALEYLTSLRGHSLTHTHLSGSEIRFGMLETIREFAAEQLGEESEVLQERHAGFYAALAAEAAPRLPGAEQAVWLARLDVESANLREALGTLLAFGNGRQALRTTSALWRYWWVHGQSAEAERWIKASLAAAADALPLERAEALQNLGNLAWRDGDGEMSLALHREGLALCKSAGSKQAAARSLTGIGNACRGLHRNDEAEAAYIQCLEIFRELNDNQGIATSLLNLGTLSEDRHDLDEAFSFYHESLIRYRELGDLHSECLTLCNLANIRVDQAIPESAHSFLSRGARIALDLADHPRIGELLTVNARLALLEGKYSHAAALLGLTQEYHRAHKLAVSPRLKCELETTADRIREHISRRDFESARESGKELTTDSVLLLGTQPQG